MAIDLLSFDLYDGQIMTTPKTLGQRLRQRMEELDISQVRLSHLAGVSQSLLSQLTNDTISETRKLSVIASALGLRSDWLATGKGQRLASADEEPRMGASIRHWVPLIEWSQVNSICMAPSLFDPEDFTEWFPITRPVSKRSYVLKVVGDTMEADSGRSYPDGTFIYVDPEREPRNGSHIIVRDSSGHCFFKKLSLDGTKQYLVPLNPRYPIAEMTPDMMVCGVVVASQQFE